MANKNIDIRKYIDYTCIKPNTSMKRVKEFIREGISAGYRGLVLYHQFLAIAYREREKANSNIKIATIWGFPWDSYTTNIFNYLDLIDEIDIVLPDAYGVNETIGKGFEDFKKLFRGKTIKIIIETLTCSLDRKKRSKEIKERVKKAEKLGADIIKTNTGLIKRNIQTPTIEEDIKLIKKFTKKPIKAAGGIRTEEQCKNLIKLGVKIIGTSIKL